MFIKISYILQNFRLCRKPVSSFGLSAPGSDRYEPASGSTRVSILVEIWYQNTKDHNLVGSYRSQIISCVKFGGLEFKWNSCVEMSYRMDQHVFRFWMKCINGSVQKRFQKITFTIANITLKLLYPLKAGNYFLRYSTFHQR